MSLPLLMNVASPVPNPGFFHVPLAEALVPASGEALVNAWWLLHPEKGLLFYQRQAKLRADRGIYPQANTSEKVSRLLRDNKSPALAMAYADHEVVQVPLVFLCHAAKYAPQPT